MIIIKFLKDIYKRFYSAVTLLTVLPMPGWQLDFNKTAPFFPWVGILLSIIYLIVFLLFNGFLSPLSMALLVIAFDGFLTGGLHLDGFSDWIDGIYSRKEGNELMDVLKDSRIGAIGGAGLVFLVMGKVFFLGEIFEGHAPLAWLVFFPWFARILMYLIIVVFPYPPGKEGLGQICREEYNVSSHILAILSCLILSLVIYIFYPGSGAILFFTQALFAGAVGGIFTYFFIKKLVGRLGGVNGDGYGASCEFSQVLILCVGALLA